MDHLPPALLVWLLGGGATVAGGLLLALVVREARIVRGHRDLDGDD